MILLFLRYSSTHRAHHAPEKKKEAPPKEATESRTPSELATVPQDNAPVAHLSESLG